MSMTSRWRVEAVFAPGSDLARRPFEDEPDALAWLLTNIDLDRDQRCYDVVVMRVTVDRVRPAA